MIIAVSDWHLGYHDDASPKGPAYAGLDKQLAILKFLDLCRNEEDLTDLVLLGDIFDFWRSANCGIFTLPLSAYADRKKSLGMASYAEAKQSSISMEDLDPGVRRIFRNQEILHGIGTLPAKVHYVIGNHDYYLLRLSGRNPGGLPFPVEKNIRLPHPADPARGYFFTHGYEMDVLANYEMIWDIETYEKIADRLCFSDNTTGTISSIAYDLLEKLNYRSLKTEVRKLNLPARKRNLLLAHDSLSYLDLFAQSKAAYLLLGMMPADVLVYGHTHVPYVSPDSTVANTGSWCCDCPGDEQFTYLRIDGDRIQKKSLTAATTQL